MLSLNNIHKSYLLGDTVVPALRGVSMDFREHEFVSVLGPSGCGKTTLLNVIGGLDRYDGGDLVINGRSTKEFRDADWDAYRNHSIGFVFQSYNLISHQTVLANVELALTLSGVSGEERRSRAVEALEKVGLGDQLKKKPNQMSGGQMQRVAIARALVNDPEILLADEPTGALDTTTSVQIMELLKEVSKTKLVIMVTHNPELAERYSTRIIRVRDGVVTDDTDPYHEGEAAGEERTEKETADLPEEKAAPTVSEAGRAEKTEKSGKKKKERDKLKRMSIRTALGLSLNNLMTKKTRTLLVSVAGSIGIIGIALILALSNGVNLFINRVQEETLTSYPISIASETADLSAMLSAMVRVDHSAEGEREERTVYVDDSISNLVSAMTDLNHNDLAAFDRYLEEHHEEIKNDITAVQRSYDMKLQIFNNTEKYGLVQVSPASFLEEFNTGENSELMSGNMSVSIFSEMMPGRDGELINDTIFEQYELLDGRWPEKAEEIVLVVDRHCTVTNLTLYMLGMCDPTELTAMMVSMMTGDKYEPNTADLRFSFDDFYDLSLNLVYNSDFYKETDGTYQVGDTHYPVWEDRREDKSFDPATLFADGLKLKIVGIIAPDPDATSTSIQGSIGYTKALTEKVLAQINDSKIVKQQLETPANDVFSGLPFTIDDADRLTDKEKADKLQDYFGRLNDAEKVELYTKMRTTLSEAEIAEKIATVKQTVTTDEEKRNFMVNMYGFANGKGSLEAGTGIRQALLPVLATIGVNEAMIDQYGDFFGLDGVALVPGEEPYVTYENLINTLYPDPAKLDRAFENMVKTTVETVNVMVEGAKITMEITNAYAARVMAENTTPAQMRAYILSCYEEESTLPEDVIAGYVNGLSEVPMIPGNPQSSPLFAEFVKALSEDTQRRAADEDFINAESAGAFLAWFNGKSEAEQAAYYTDYMEKSEHTYEGNLQLTGASAGRDALTMINIYPVDFEAKERLADMIRNYNAGVEEEDKIHYTDIVAIVMSSVTTIVNAISYVLIAFVSISLVVSSIMIGIITYISVLERTKEIGILRAIGASKRDISRVFNAETLIIGFAAGAIGILTTLLLCLPINLIIHAASGINDISARLPLLGGIALILISMALTLIAGVIPSHIAAKKDPVVALRTE